MPRHCDRLAPQQTPPAQPTLDPFHNDDPDTAAWETLAAARGCTGKKSTPFSSLLEEVAAQYSSLEVRLQVVLSENALLRAGDGFAWQSISATDKGNSCRFSDKLRTDQICMSQHAMKVNSIRAGPSSADNYIYSEHTLHSWRRFVDTLLHSDKYMLLACWHDDVRNWGAEDETMTDVTHDADRNGGTAHASDEFSVVSVYRSLSRKRYKGRTFISRGELREDGFTQLLVMHPSCQRRVAWLGLSILMMSFDAFSFSIEPFTHGVGRFWHSLDLLSASFWSMDMILAFFTAIYIDRQLETRLRKIACHYAKTWLAFDLLCTAPLWIDLYSADVGGVSQVVKAIKSLRYLRLLRFVKLRQLAQVIANAINSITVLLAVRTMKEVFVLIIFIHVAACLWFLSGDREGGWAFFEHYDDKQPVYMYVESCYWAVALLQGSTNVTPGSTLLERVYAVVTTIIAVIFLARLVSKMTNLMIELHELEEQYSQMATVRAYFLRNRISDDLRERMRMYIQTIQRDVAMQKQVDEEKVVLQLLPTVLKRQVIGETRAIHLDRNPCFHALKVHCYRCFERLCCDSLQTVYSQPQEKIFNYGDECHSTHVTIDGKVGYLVYDGILGQIGADGMARSSKARDSKFQDVQRNSSSTFVNPMSLWQHDRHARVITGFAKRFSEAEVLVENHLAVAEAALWTHWIHVGDCFSASHASLFKLPSRDFQNVCACYVFALRMLKRHAEVFVNMLNDGGSHNKSDLFDSYAAIKRLEVKRPQQFLQMSRHFQHCRTTSSVHQPQRA